MDQKTVGLTLGHESKYVQMYSKRSGLELYRIFSSGTLAK